MTNIKNRIEALRIAMRNNQLDAIYISGTDPHSSEYLPERWQTREFITGFTGSYGMVVITKEEAGLWTDTRYFIQAEEQLKTTGITMHKLRVPDAISPEDWLAINLEKKSRVGIDAQTVSIASFKNMKNVLAENEIELVQTADLLNSVWENRPEWPDDAVFELDVKIAGLSRKEKRELIISEIRKSGADLHVISTLDELAWTYNLRGSDVKYNPVFTGFAIIGESQSSLFVGLNKINESLKIKLENEGIIIKDYGEFYESLSALKNKKVFVDPQSANFAICENLKGNEILEGTSKIAILKSRKNKTELAGFKQAMKNDGIALIEFLFWLKSNLGKIEITEFTVGKKLAEFRSKQEGFKGESFPPIVGYKSHGAIVHLSVGEKDALKIEPEGILLFDSGGQYLNGTTDITRTVALGAVTKQQKMDYSLVLKGMIALTNAIFPYGTLGCHLDILARKPLWENGMNYGHGTGHGVGHFLNVHEGPMAIRQEYNENKIEPGNVMSNEPAFYREGLYGIRTENMMVCVEKEDTEFGKFLGFETLTLCPIDTKLIDTELISSKEKEWINQYHRMVNTELKPLIDSRLHEFLNELTNPI